MSTNAETDASGPVFLTNKKFCEEIAKRIHRGGGLTPFVGSGLSAQSGIMMGQEFDEYLAVVVHLCVVGEGGKDSTRRWSPRRDGWPSHPTAEQVKEMRKWVMAEFSHVCHSAGWRVEPSDDGRVRGISPIGGQADVHWLSKVVATPFIPVVLRGNGVPVQAVSTEDPFDPALDPRPIADESRLRQLHRVLGKDGLKHGGWLRANLSPTSSEMIAERAIRSLYDWRATLQFLSEIVHDEQDGKPRLAKPERDVIDTFNHHIVQGKRPNLGHVMLCHLSRAVRSRVFLTTNFDKLIEQAFADAGDHIEEIPVSINGRLPSPRVVHSANTIVKLHGSLSETRADFSLDEPASLDDKERFFDYIRGGPPSDRRNRFLPTDLFVVGFSGNDVRCIEMMKYVLDYDSQAHIFWLCHSQRDRDKLKALFHERSYDRRLTATVCQRADLLFYELYQVITLSQPPGGLGHHLSDTLPPDTSFEMEEISDPKEKAKVEGFCKLTDQWAKDIGDRLAQCACLPLVAVKGGPGILAAMSKVAHASYDNRTVWLEMEDFFDTASLAYGLFHALATHRGIYRIGHFCLVPQDLAENIKKDEGHNPITKFQERLAYWKKHVKCVCERMRINRSEWLIALYGRNGPGGCQGWGEKDYWGKDGNAADYGTAPPDHTVSEFVALLGGLASAGFRVLYAPFPGEPVSDKQRLHAHDEPSLQYWLGQLPLADKTILDLKPTPQGKPFENLGQESVEEVKQWIRDAGAQIERKKRTKFSYGISLFRQSRHFTALLRTRAIERPKPFNLECIDNDRETAKIVRDYLATWERFPRVFHPKPGGFEWLYRDVREQIQKVAGRGMEKERAFFEYSIAQWYVEAHQVTGHALPLMEAVHHFYQATQCSAAIKSSSPGLPFFWWRKSMVGLISALQSGEMSMLYWLGRPALRKWFEDKVPQQVVGNCRRASRNMNDPSKKDLLELLDSILKRLAQRVQRSELHRPDTRRTEPRSTRQILGLPPRDDGDGWLKMFLDCAKQSPDKRSYPSEETLVNEFQKRSGSDTKRALAPLEALQRLVEEAHSISRRAKKQTQAEFRCDKEDPALPIRYVGKGRGSTVKLPQAHQKIHEKWREVCLRASLALELASWITPGAEEFVMRQRGKAYMIYGLALARQYRFTSAHRLLNNARRVFQMIGNEAAKVQIGMVELRAAEAFLLEAQLARDIAATFPKQTTAGPVKFPNEAGGLEDWIKTFRAKPEDEDSPVTAEDSPVTVESLLRLCQARIDDAWVSLEIAHRLLGFHTHEARWWGRLYAMHLRCFMIMPKDPENRIRLLPNRKDHDLGALLFDIYERGIQTAPHDLHNRLRTADYFIRAVLNTCSERDIRRLIAEKDIEELLKEDLRMIEADADSDNHTKLYLAKFRKRLDKLGKPSTEKPG